MIISDKVIFSSDYTYRYWLKREVLNWGKIIAAVPTCLFIMLNPSTADHLTNDATVRRCMGYARAWGYPLMEVVNLFALRSTDPAELYKCQDPIGGGYNDRIILERAKHADKVIAAWGNHGALNGRGDHVLSMLWREGISIYSLGMTAKRQPKHPLRLAKQLRPSIMHSPLTALHGGQNVRRS